MFTLGKLAQVIHVVEDLPGADALYRRVFGGERFYQGYSPYEKRDASLIAIGDFTIEPMSPADEEGADAMPVGRFFGRFGSHLHSIAINTKGVLELYEHLRSKGVRVFGPGGTDPTEQIDADVKSIYTHPKDSHCLLELVDFGGDVVASSPRAGDDWDPTRWRDEHPLGLVRPSHITVVVHDLEPATTFFTDVLDCPVFHESTRPSQGTASRFLLLGSETVVELAQPVGDGGRAAHDLSANGEIVHAVTLQVVDLDRAIDHVSSQGVTVVDRNEGTAVLDPTDCLGAIIGLTDMPLPGDPRST